MFARANKRVRAQTFYNLQLLLVVSKMTDSSLINPIDALGACWRKELVALLAETAAGEPTPLSTTAATTTTASAVASLEAHAITLTGIVAPGKFEPRVRLAMLDVLADACGYGNDASDLSPFVHYERLRLATRDSYASVLAALQLSLNTVQQSPRPSPPSTPLSSLLRSMSYDLQRALDLFTSRNLVRYSDDVDTATDCDARSGRWTTCFVLALLPVEAAAVPLEFVKQVTDHVMSLRTNSALHAQAHCVYLWRLESEAFAQCSVVLMRRLYELTRATAPVGFVVAPQGDDHQGDVARFIEGAHTSAAIFLCRMQLLRYDRLPSCLCDQSSFVAGGICRIGGLIRANKLSSADEVRQCLLARCPEVPLMCALAHVAYYEARTDIADATRNELLAGCLARVPDEAIVSLAFHAARSVVHEAELRRFVLACAAYNVRSHRLLKQHVDQCIADRAPALKAWADSSCGDCEAECADE